MQAPQLKTTKDASEDVERIEEDVFAIIESKIQYNDYRIKTAANSFINLEDNPTAEKIPSEMKRIINNNEHIIDLIRKYTGAINLLLVLRSKLNQYNVRLVLNVLEDDQYLSLTKQDLISCIGGEPHQMSA